MGGGKAAICPVWLYVRAGESLQLISNNEKGKEDRLIMDEQNKL